MPAKWRSPLRLQALSQAPALGSCNLIHKRGDKRQTLAKTSPTQSATDWKNHNMYIKPARNLQGKEQQSDTYADNVPVSLTKRELRELSAINPIVSCLHICAEWNLILATVYLCERFWNPFLYLLAVALIGARQHALLILVHEGAHYRLFQNKQLNDWAAELLLAWPCLVSARAYRQNHFAHHRYLNTDRDPDWARKQGDAAWVFPKQWSQLAALLLRDLSGLGAMTFLRIVRKLSSNDNGISRKYLGLRYGFYVAVVLAIVSAGETKLFAIYWLVPMFTWLILIFRVRSIAEHSAIERGYVQVKCGKYAHTRTTHVSVIERLFVAPKNVNYHIEHHFYPSVPFYRLPQLHAVLLSKPGFRESAHLTNTYWGVLREAIGRTALKP